MHISEFKMYLLLKKNYIFNFSRLLLNPKASFTMGSTAPPSDLTNLLQHLAWKHILLFTLERKLSSKSRSKEKIFNMT